MASDEHPDATAIPRECRVTSASPHVDGERRAVEAEAPHGHRAADGSATPETAPSDRSGSSPHRGELDRHEPDRQTTGTPSTSGSAPSSPGGNRRPGGGRSASDRRPPAHRAVGAVPRARTWDGERSSARFDARFPAAERLPDRVDYLFRTGPRERDGVPVTTISIDGTPIGDPLTDACRIPDGYRLHDAFHLAYATVLGWSPVTRALLDRKRRSDPATDENEDGGRAVAVEEGIAALVFGHASHRGYLEGHDRIEPALLHHIREFVTGFEVTAIDEHEWEQAILAGFGIWHLLRDHGGQGLVRADLRARRMTYLPVSGLVTTSVTAPRTADGTVPLRRAHHTGHRGRNPLRHTLRRTGTDHRLHGA
ncbi:hypothetical protein [Saccharothrix hoggarensis]|uniref:MazG C-terminal domain-containing protein n=1 Tax=Saccharothrix hoggarensis TaxID=913853 RepID=A0ABW3QG88_9PSEU